MRSVVAVNSVCSSGSGFAPQRSGVYTPAYYDRGRFVAAFEQVCQARPAPTPTVSSTGADVFTLKGHRERSVISASFSADGARVVTGSGDKTAKVWDAKTGAEVLTLKGHKHGICVDLASFRCERVARGHGQLRQDGEGVGR